MSPSSSQRPLMLRARADVVAAAVRVAGSPRWVVTDPVTLAHFDLSDQEHALLTNLREGVSLRDLQRAFEQQFAPRRISLDEVWRFVSRLHREGLAVATGAGQGTELLERRGKQQREQLAWAWTRLLAIKLPGVNPTWFLDALYPLVRWAFSMPAMLLMACLMAVAGWIVLVDYGALTAGMPGLNQMVSPRGLSALLVTAIGVKVLHELGHALACKHFGGQVHEMGVLLLAFAPAMYCDVSDMWRLPSKRKRMAVTAAGIWVELCLAAIAVIVWRYSADEVLRLAALNVTIVCTVGTLLVNANPLLRYDGYYLLSDWTETPNLWQRSRESVGAMWGDWFTKRSEPREPIRPRWLPLYGAASQAYLVVVIVSILWMVSVALRPYRLDALAWIVAAVAVAGIVAPQVKKLGATVRDPSARRRWRAGRASVALLVAAIAIVGVANAPWRYTVQGEATAVLNSPTAVVATVEGRLVEIAAEGDSLQAGDVVARLVNPEVERELLKAKASLAEASLRVTQLDALRMRDKQSGDELPAAQSAVEDYKQQLAQLQSQADLLTLKADMPGVVVRAESIADENPDGLTLARWSGNLLDERNLGASVKPGEVVCQIVEAGDMCAEVSLSEDDIERVQIGQSVQLAWRQTPGRVLHGEVLEVSQRALRPASDQPKSEPRYLVRVRLIDPPTRMVIDGLGRAKISTGSTTIGQLLVTRVRQMFRLP